MKKILSLLSAVTLTAVGSNSVMAMSINENVRDTDISSWQFRDPTTIDVTGSDSDNVQIKVWAEMIRSYPEYANLFAEIIQSASSFTIIGNDFKVPNVNSPLNYSVTIIPMQGSGFTGVLDINLRLMISNLNPISGDAGFSDGESIGSNWSTNNTWGSKDNDNKIELFNFKKYESSWGEFQLNYTNFTIDTSSSFYSKWTSSSHIPLPSSYHIDVTEISPDDGYTQTMVDWSDGSIEGTSSVDMWFKLEVDLETGDVTLSPHIHLQIMHLGAGTRWVSGLLYLGNWSIK